MLPVCLQKLRLLENILGDTLVALIKNVNKCHKKYDVDINDWNN